MRESERSWRLASSLRVAYIQLNAKRYPYVNHWFHC